MEGVGMPLYTSRGLRVTANIAWSISAPSAYLSLFRVFLPRPPHPLPDHHQRTVTGKARGSDKRQELQRRPSCPHCVA